MNAGQLAFPSEALRPDALAAPDGDDLADLDLAHARRVLAGDLPPAAEARPCLCIHPLLMADEGEPRCLRCGHEPETVAA
jgi:hypothetical protein